MELVYLWVEDYKNIKKQEFNFSPRFHCAYDEESNELTIDENDDYIPDFFGENINVTAIVGKNGSGKSSVLEYLSDSPKFIVIFEDNQFFINQNIQVKNKTLYNFIFNYNFFEKNSTYIKIVYSEGEGSIGEDSSYLFKIQTTMYLNSKNNLNTIIFPKKIFYVLDKDIYFDIIRYGIKEKVHPLLSNDKLEKMSLSEKIYIYLFNIFVSSSLFLDKNNFFYLFLKKNTHILSTKELFLSFKEELNEDKDKKLFKKAYNYAQLFQEYTNIYVEKGLIEKRVDNGDTYGEEIHDELYSIPFNNDNIQKILKEIDYFHGHYFRWNINLSAGELSLINFLAKIFENLKDSNNIKYLYIDEGESFLHPNWQKKYLSYIIQFLKDNFPNRKIHIILTSHSPFLLSDIPKQNIIFLDKDEKGNCKVVNGLKEKKQTFGANIHTLLSDSFFMEDGLMGEFAKSKIDDVINYLHDRESKIKSDDEAQKLIHIIGEPIVKNQLQRMLDSRRLKKVDRIDAIEKDIKALTEKLARLKND